MKIAYLILAHDNYAHLERLLTALRDPGQQIRFYIHIDKKSEFPRHLEAPDVTFVRRRSVSWGGWSQQESILELMVTARKTNHDYYLLLSGVDYPARPQSQLYSKLATGDLYMNIWPDFTKDKAEGRVKYYHFDGFNRKDSRGLKTRLMLKAEGLLRRVAQKTKYPFERVYHGSTWWAMPHECLSYLLDFIDANPQYPKFYRSSFCADEGMFHTILGNSAWLARCKGNLTFTDWSAGGGSPANISEKHLALFAGLEDGPNFARKFSDKTLTLLNRIDRIRQVAVTI